MILHEFAALHYDHHAVSQYFDLEWVASQIVRMKVMLRRPEGSTVVAGGIPYYLLSHIMPQDACRACKASPGNTSSCRSNYDNWHHICVDHTPSSFEYSYSCQTDSCICLCQLHRSNNANFF